MPLDSDADPMMLTPVDMPVDPPADAPPVPTEPTPVRVSDLLASSRQSHMLYHQHLPRMVAVPGSTPQAQPGDAAAALTALKSAAAARAQAELIDPQHTDPSWADDAQTTPHQETLVFMLQQLSK